MKKKSRYQIENEILKGYRKVHDIVGAKHKVIIVTRVTFNISKANRKKWTRKTPKSIVDDFFRKEKLKTGRE